jgi:hypothetical protein
VKNSTISVLKETDKYGIAAPDLNPRLNHSRAGSLGQAQQKALLAMMYRDFFRQPAISQHTTHDGAWVKIDSLLKRQQLPFLPFFESRYFLDNIRFFCIIAVYFSIFPGFSRQAPKQRWMTIPSGIEKRREPFERLSWFQFSGRDSPRAIC